MYRALLYQIAEDAPEIQDLVEPETRECYKSQGWSQGWPLELLRDLFRDAVLIYGRKRMITCYVDALDECEEDEVREMLVLLEELGEETTLAGLEFSACLASRHYPNVTVGHLEEIVLEDRQGHHDDISPYVESKLNLHNIEYKVEFAGEIRFRSSGVFLWVVLVVAILNKLNAQGNIHQLRNRLQEMPINLRELFDDILSRDEPNEYLIPMIQWTLFAGRRLSVVELYFAILLCTPQARETMALWDRRLIDVRVLRDFVITNSKGLLETGPLPHISEPEHLAYGFIHESVREYFLDTGLQRLDPNLSNNVQATSHEWLAHACTEHIIQLSVPLEEETPFNLLVDPPILDYIRDYGALFHADRAAPQGVFQTEFCASFPLHHWLSLYINHGQHYFERGLYLARHDATLLHVLVTREYKNQAQRELNRYITSTDHDRTGNRSINAQCRS